MRFLLSAACLLLLAGCGTTPVPVITPDRPQVGGQAARVERGALIGLDASSLSARLGSPRLQVREGNSVKLQFGASGCLLDAYLYPGASGGVARVAHVDTRTRDGRAIDQATCLRMLELR